MPGRPSFRRLRRCPQKGYFYRANSRGDGLAGQAGADIRAIFEAPGTTPRERKQLIRALLSEVTLTVDRQTRTAALTLCWEGGAITERTVTLPRLAPRGGPPRHLPWT